MRLGVIGKPLAHSWSPEIHKYFLGKDLDYSKWEMEKDELRDFYRKRDFDGISITIPYKKESIQYLDELDPDAERLQAVNCVINENGKLKGYNTDVIGLERMARMHGINKENGQVAILGSGGASIAAEEVCRIMGWKYYTVSRSKHDDCIDYDDLYKMADDIVLLINSTPVGLLPNVDGIPADLDRLPSVKYVLDVVANPVRSRLVLEARERGLMAFGGLEMLIAQGWAADEIFTHEKIDDAGLITCMESICNEKLNIVLIGMPCAGKTTLGVRLAEALGRPYCEMDDEIIRQTGMPIADYFAEHGEASFRDLESELCRKLIETTGMVISTGGGVIKRPENMRYLAHNGIVVWLDRDLSKMEGTASRPLARNHNDLVKLYEERKDLYTKYADIRVENNGSIDDTLADLIEALK